MDNRSAVQFTPPPGAEIQHRGGGQFCLSGTVDFDNAGRVMADGQRLFIDHDRVVIDASLAEVSSTAGLAVMMEWASWCGIRDISLVYEGMQSGVLAVAELNGVTTMLPVRHRKPRDPSLSDATGRNAYSCNKAPQMRA